MFKKIKRERLILVTINRISNLSLIGSLICYAIAGYIMSDSINSIDAFRDAFAWLTIVIMVIDILLVLLKYKMMNIRIVTEKKEPVLFVKRRKTTVYSDNEGEKTMFIIKRNTPVVLLYDKYHYYRVRLEDGTEAYVESTHLDF